MIIVIILVVVVVIVALVFVAGYNRLVRFRNRVDSSWSQIGVQLNRRHDLIPNLVETVKGYAAHEKGTLEAVVQARNAAVQAQGPEQQGQAENVLSGALRQLFALSEAYPDLKANTTFLNLQEELTSTEDRISYARQFYNDVVLKYNNKLQTIPTNIIGGMFNFTQREYFATPEEANVAPKVQF